MAEVNQVTYAWQVTIHQRPEMTLVEGTPDAEERGLIPSKLAAVEAAVGLCEAYLEDCLGTRKKWLAGEVARGQKLAARLKRQAARAKEKS